MKTLISILSLFSLLLPRLLCAHGDLCGTIVDENGEGIPFATIAVVVDGIPNGQGTITDFDGNYSLTPLEPGSYDVQFSYVGYQTRMYTGICIDSAESVQLDVCMDESEYIMETYCCGAYTYDDYPRRSLRRDRRWYRRNFRPAYERRMVRKGYDYCAPGRANFIAPPQLAETDSLAPPIEDDDALIGQSD